MSRLPVVGEQPYGPVLLDWLLAGRNADGRLKGAATVKSISDDAYSGSAAGNDSLDNTAALLAALDDINTAGGGTLYLPPGGTYRYSSIYKVMTAPVTIVGYGATLKSTLNKTSDTIACHLEGNNVKILGAAFDYVTPITVDVDAPTQGPQAHTIRLGKTGASLFYTDCLIRDVTIKNCRNSPISVIGYSRCRIIDNTLITAMGNGIVIGDNPFDTLIRGNVIIDVGDDGIAILSDAALPALCQHVVIVGNTIYKSYAHGIDMTGVDGGIVDHNIIEKTWGNGIIAWHDSTDNLGTCKNVYIGDGNIIKDAGQYFGVGQFKDAAVVGGAYGVNIANDVDRVVVGRPIIVNPNMGPITFGVTGTGTVRRTGLPPQRWGPADYIKTPGTGVATTTAVADLLYAVLVEVPELTTAININVTVTGAGSAGSVLRLGIYNDAGDCHPGKLLVDGGTVVATSTGTKSVTINQVLPPGIYWLVAVGQGAPATQPTVNSLTGQPPGMPTVQDPGTSINGFYMNSVTGALPATFAIQGYTGTAVAISLGSHA